MNTSLYFGATLALTLAVGTQAATLDEAIREALAHNRQIRISAAQVERRKYEVEAEKTKRLPTVNVSGTAGISLTRADVTFPRGSFGDYAGTGPIPGDDTRVGIPRQLSGFSYSSFSLPLTQQSRIGARIAGARLEVELAANDRERTEHEVVRDVRQLYFASLAAEAAAKATEANLTLAKEVERLASEGLDIGTTLPSERGEAVARRIRGESAVSAIAADRANLREQLNLLLGRALDESFEFVQPAEAFSSDLTLAEMRRLAASGRPEIVAAQLRVQQTETSIRARRAEFIPDVSLTVQHFGFLNTGNLAPSNYAVAGLQVSWEPWDWGRKKRELQSLRSQAEGARLAVEDSQQQVQRQASQALRAWEQSGRDVATARAAVVAAQESLRVVRERFGQQAALMRQLLEAQATFETAQEQQVRAEASRGTAWANLQLAIGRK